MVKKLKSISKALCAVIVCAGLVFTGCTAMQGSKGPVNEGSVKDGTDSSIKDNTAEGQKTEDGDGTGSDKTEDKQDAGSSDGQGSTGEGGSEDDGFVLVSSTEELLNLIEPGAKIKIAPGYYNMSDYLSGSYVNTKDRDEWNEQHKYVKLQEVYDGAEIILQDVDGLEIKGGTDSFSDTEIVIDPRYATVLVFSASDNIKISNVTVGHTDGGDCSGGVLGFNYCRNITLDNVDLYGCGVYGIECLNSTSDLHVSDSVIRDCEFGSFEIYNVTGDFVFNRCTFTGSGWGGYFEGGDLASLAFNNCKFGHNETNTWYFREDVVLNDCEFEEPTEYPDYGDYGYEVYIPLFNPEEMTTLKTDLQGLLYTSWNAYVRVNPESGETYYYDVTGDLAEDHCSIFFREEDIAELNICDNYEDCSWGLLDESQGVIASEKGNRYFTMYVNDYGESWLSMQYDNDVIWFFQ